MVFLPTPSSIPSATSTTATASSSAPAPATSSPTISASPLPSPPTSPTATSATASGSDFSARHRYALSLVEAAAAPSLLPRRGRCRCWLRNLRPWSHGLPRRPPTPPPPLPEFDAVRSPEHTVRTSPSFAEIESQKAEQVIGQGRYLLQCATKWFLTTGQQPFLMVAAVTAFVEEVNRLISKENATKTFPLCSSSHLRSRSPTGHGGGGRRMLSKSHRPQRRRKGRGSGWRTGGERGRRSGGGRGRGHGRRQRRSGTGSEGRSGGRGGGGCGGGARSRWWPGRWRIRRDGTGI